MRLVKVVAVIALLSLATPVFAARTSDGPSVADRLVKFAQKLIHSIVANGGGLIPPIPGPQP
jgi:hypothetical protein